MGIYLQRVGDGRTYGTLVIDRVIRGHRLKVTTGTTDRRTARRMNDLIDELKNRGMDTQLQSLMERRVTIRQLYELDQRGELMDVGRFDPQLIQPLVTTIDRWATSYRQWSDKTRQSSKELLKTMFNRMSPQFPKPSVGDTPQLLRAYRVYCETNDIPRVFNRLRSVFHRFVRVTFGKTTTLYQQVNDVEKLFDRPKNPQTAKTPGQIEKLVRALPDKYRGMVWTMCTTGVGWDEYGKMTSRSDIKNPRVTIDGTKMDHKDGRRRREVPFVYPPTARVGSERQFRKILKATAETLRMENLNVYTFRKCYANWLVESGTPQWRVEMYMGHLPQSQTQKYQTTEVWRWLKEDGERLHEWLSEKRKQRGSRED